MKSLRDFVWELRTARSLRAVLDGLCIDLPHDAELGAAVRELFGPFPVKPFNVELPEKIAACRECGEVPHASDPALSAGLCVYCGYFTCPPGPVRDRIRANREKEVLP